MHQIIISKKATDNIFYSSVIGHGISWDNDKTAIILNDSSDILTFDKFDDFVSFIRSRDKSLMIHTTYQENPRLPTSIF